MVIATLQGREASGHHPGQGSEECSGRPAGTRDKPTEEAQPLFLGPHDSGPSFKYCIVDTLPPQLSEQLAMSS